MKGYIRADLRVYHLSQFFFLKLGNSMQTLCLQDKHNWLMGKTCEPKAFSFQCMTKFTTNKKIKK